MLQFSVTAEIRIPVKWIWIKVQVQVLVVIRLQLQCNAFQSLSNVRLVGGRCVGWWRLSCWFICAASGEPPLLLAASVHCAIRAAIRDARQQLSTWGACKDGSHSTFHVEVPANMPVVKELCGFDNVERYLMWKMNSNWGVCRFMRSLELIMPCNMHTNQNL